MEVVIHFDRGTRLSMNQAGNLDRIALTIYRDGMEPETATVTKESMVQAIAVLVELKGIFDITKRN